MMQPPRKTIFLSRSFAHRQPMQPIANKIYAVAHSFNLEVIDFVAQPYAADDAQGMMADTFAAIRDCTLVIAEISYKAIGIGIEVGYAAALQKPILYLRQQDAEHSTTVAGIARDSIVYHTPANLQTLLSHWLQNSGIV